MVKEITRYEAEKLFFQSDVISTEIEQDDKALCVLLTLSDNNSCLVKYDLKNQEKSYFVSNKL